MPDKTTAEPIKIVQITDSHLGDNLGDALLSMDADESLGDVLRLIKQQIPAPDIILATGDIANDATVDAYRRFITTVARDFPYPMYWLPGNHDNPAMMEQALGKPRERVIAIGQWVIIMLDSHVPQQIYGDLTRDELDFLESALSDASDKHVLVCLHHQPVPIGSAWMDSYIVRSAHAFWDIIKRHSQVRAVVWGHVHQTFEDTYNKVALLSTPSTCIQFTPEEDDFDVDVLMPGYRWFELYADGQFKTGVERVATKDYGIDFNSKGY